MMLLVPSSKLQAPAVIIVSAAFALILPGVVFLLCFVALLLTIYMTSAYKWNRVVLVVVFCALLCHSLCSSPCVVGTTFLPPGAWCSECKTQSLQSPLR